VGPEVNILTAEHGWALLSRKAPWYKRSFYKIKEVSSISSILQSVHTSDERSAVFEEKKSKLHTSVASSASRRFFFRTASTLNSKKLRRGRNDPHLYDPRL